MRKRLVGTAPLLAICILFLFFIILWYKQFTFFNYAGATTYMNDELAAEYAEGAREVEFSLDEGYLNPVARVIFWTKKYADIRIENLSADPVQITMAGYYGDLTDTMPDAVIIEPGESVSVVADETPGYVVTAYDAEGTVSPSDIVITHDNVAYMSRWKKAVFFMLAGVAGWTGLCLILLMLPRDWEKNRKAVGGMSVAAGVLAFVLAAVCCIMDLEPWTDCLFSLFTAYSSAVALAYFYEKKPETQKSPLLGGIAAGAVSLFVFFLLITSGLGIIPWSMVGETSSSRILIFGFSFMVFIVLYLVLGQLSMRFSVFNLRLESFFSDRLSFVAGLLFPLALLHGHLGYEKQNVLIVLALAVLFACGGRFIASVRSVPDFIWYICYLGLSVFYLLANVVLNMWVDGYGMNHTDIYYNPVCMVAEGLPLQDIGLDTLYGHYALFYILPFKLFGADMKTVAVVTGFSAGVSLFIALLLMHKLVEKSVSRIVGALLVFCSLTMTSLYLQNFPCRVLFPFVLLYFVFSCQDKELSVAGSGGKDPAGSKISALFMYIGGYIICMLAVLWNTETGLVCSLAWAVYRVMYAANRKGLISYFVRFVLELPFMLFEIIGAVLIWRLYNFCIVLKTSDLGYAFKYGLLMAQKGDDFGGGYISGTDNGVLRWQNEPWLYIILLIILLTVVLLAYSGVFDPKKDNKAAAGYLAAVVVMLGHFVYWLTRPEEYDIILPALTLAMLVLYEKYNVGAKKKNMLIIAYLLVCFSLAKFAYRIPLSFERNISLITSGIGSAERYDEELASFSRNVPENCCTSGRGLRELYLDLDWDYRRAEDVDISEETFIISESGKAEFEGYVLIREVPVGQHVYYLYENRCRAPKD